MWMTLFDRMRVVGGRVSSPRVVDVKEYGGGGSEVESIFFLG